jgi:hypothetical protein
LEFIMLQILLGMEANLVTLEILPL